MTLIISLTRGFHLMEGQTVHSTGTLKENKRRGSGGTVSAFQRETGINTDFMIKMTSRRILTK